MFLDLNELKDEIVGSKVPEPISGTLSGHAAGEPFDKHVYAAIKKRVPHYSHRQYEFLNKLYQDNPEASDYQSRSQLINSQCVQMLINRGKDQIKTWSIDNLFVEKQNDTADILITDNHFFQIVDVKTRNLKLKGQAPNIISAFKLARLAKEMLDYNEYNVLSIEYLEIDWLLKEHKLECIDFHYANLFKENPEKLYINWAAAMQIQFHVSELKQDFEGTIKEWAIQYLKHFSSQAKRRADEMHAKFYLPFKNYYND